MNIAGLSERAASLIRAFEPGLAGTDRPVRLAHLAAVLRNKGLTADAARVGLFVLREWPDDMEAGLVARIAIGEDVPPFHIPMLMDAARADAYARSLAMAVKPGMIVLDIGTGSGLLAILAARAGAALVIACERDPALAVIAAETVHRNGCADRVRVIAKDSSALIVGEDLPRRADLLVSEIVDGHLLGEGVLDAVAHARAHLLQPDAVTIPVSGSIHAAVGDDPAGPRALGAVAGVDVSAMEAVRARHHLSRRQSIELATDVATVFRFDLSGGAVSDSGAADCAVRAHRDITAHGLLQWMSMDLGNGVELHSGPGSASSEWPMLWVPSPRPLTLRAGDTLRVRGRHSRSTVLVWVEA